jgi:HdeA/HdeB family
MACLGTERIAFVFKLEGSHMRKLAFLAIASFMIAGSIARAQVPLSSYADADGFIDVQTLMCSQLAGTFQEDADMLTTWYSGWYNGLAKKHFIHVTRAKVFEHEIILYCKAHPNVKIISAIDVLLKDEKLTGTFK